MPVTTYSDSARRLRAIAVTTVRRSAVAPELPTLAESGLPGFDASTWQAVFAPAGTPQPVLDRLSAEILASLRKPDVVARIDKLGFTVEPRDPASFRPYWENEVATWVKIAKDAGVQAEE